MRFLPPRAARLAPRAFLLGGLFVALWCTAQPAWASESQEGSSEAAEDTTRAVQEAFNAGLAEYRRENFEEARRYFLTAWELRPFKGIALSLAEVEMQLGLYLEAADHWRYVLDHTGAGAERDTAEEQLAECRRRLGRIRLDLSTTGARITAGTRTIEDAFTSEELLVQPGTTVLAVELAGYRTERRRFVIEPGETVDLRIQLDRERPPPPVEPTSHAAAEIEESSMSPRTALVLGGAALTATALVAGTVYRFKAIRHRQDADHLRRKVDEEGDPAVARNALCHPDQPNRPPSCAELKSSVRKTWQAQDVSTVAFVAGGVLGAATLATWLFWPESSEESATGSGSSSWSAGPWSPAEGWGLQVSGTF